MSTEMLTLLAAGIFVVAILYSSVGHAGASGYIAVMSLLGLTAAVIKPTALALNILVAAIASWQFMRAGHFSWRLFWPFAALAVPMAYVGGAIVLPAAAFKLLVGVVLLYSAARFFIASPQEKAVRPVSLPAALAIGAVIGLLSGLTGTGGGIFLTPLLLLMGWARAKSAAAVSALFILLNSAAGLLGNVASTRNLPADIPLLLLVAAAGGWIGSTLGSHRLPPLAIKRLLAAVLTIAGAKLLLS